MCRVRERERTPSRETPAAKGNKQAAEPELLAGGLGACLQSQYVGSGGRGSRSSNHIWLHSEFEVSLAYKRLSQETGTTIVSLRRVLLIGRFLQIYLICTAKYICALVHVCVCVCVNKSIGNILFSYLNKFVSRGVKHFKLPRLLFVTIFKSEMILGFFSFQGVPCDLVTGEERQTVDPEGKQATHVSCTVEMCSVTTPCMYMLFGKQNSEGFSVVKPRTYSLSMKKLQI